MTNEILASGSLEGKIIVDTSTVHPGSSTTASEKLTKAGALFVAGNARNLAPQRSLLTNFLAPVFGASPVAEAGQLLFIIAGPSIAKAAIAPFLQGVMGRGAIDLGEDVSKSSLMKTTG